jgi:hypothetical protein
MANKEEKVIDLQAKKTVYATGKGKYYQAGDEITVHPILAEKLVKSGKATEKAPKQ